MGAKKIEYKEGDVIGELVFIEETEPKEYTFTKLSRMARFKCKCGGEIITNITSAKSRATRSCGCEATGKYNGLSKHPLFKHWACMKTRCFNPNHSDYHLYGGRGITVYQGWVFDPQAYIDYISSLENFKADGYTSIDRIDNDGNYEPGNIRWATQSMQVQNRATPKSKSGYVGVYLKKKKGRKALRYRATVFVNGERCILGQNFHTPKDAAIARDLFILEHGLNQNLQVLDRAT